MIYYMPYKRIDRNKRTRMERIGTNVYVQKYLVKIEYNLNPLPPACVLYTTYPTRTFLNN